jgi:hypothetical protein
MKWYREPLLHFLLAGLALFAVYGGFRAPPQQEEPRRIEITTDDIRRLEMAWAARWQRPPTTLEMRGLIEDQVREDILYREALALGLDQGDTIVKRRLAQKMDFLAQDVTALRDPSREELTAWFENNQERFRQPPRASFHHLYFSFDQRQGRAQEDARHVLATQAGKKAGEVAEDTVGDRFMFQSFYPDKTPDQVAQVFGTKFAAAQFQLTPGVWQGPIESGYGWHLVFVEALTPGRVPAFEEIETSVQSEWLAEQRAEARRQFYDALKARYEIVIQDTEPTKTAGQAAAHQGGTR